VAAGETLHSIAQLYGVKIDKLAKLNAIDKNQEPTAGSNIFVGKIPPFAQP
jgi:LysM repeat protein